MISSAPGKRASRCLEKTSLPSALTSKMPFAPLTSSGSMPSACRISAAKLTARGR